MDILEIISNTFTNADLMSALISSIVITLLSFFLRKKNIFNKTTSKTLSTLLLTISIPALAFNSFMQDIDSDTLRQGLSVLIWGVIIYVILIFLTLVTYTKYSKKVQDILRMSTIFGSTTFFGIPIISAVYGVEGAMFATLFNIGYRVYLYSYCYIKISDLKMEKKDIKGMFLNPIILATFFGLFIWLFQDFMPQIEMIIENEEHLFAFLRLDTVIPQFYRPVTLLASLASPLAWLAIGATLAEISLKEAVKFKVVWQHAFMKVAIVPMINIAFLILLVATNVMSVSFVAFATMTIMMATPVSTVVTAFAIGFDKEAVLASNCSLVSTIIAVIAMPIWLIVLQIIYNLGIF